MFSKKIALITSISSILFISSAHADYLYNHYVGQYVSFNAGATYVNKIYDYGCTKGGFLGAGSNLFLGDQINPYFAPEVGVGYFSFGSNGGVTMFSVNGRFTFPIGESISLFTKLGAGYAEVITRLTTKVSKNSFLPALGMGMGYGVTPKTMVTAEANGVYLPQSMGNSNGVMFGLTVGVTHYWHS